MINERKVIGVCLTRIHDTTISNYISKIHSLARKQGYKVLVFNSFVDFYHGDAFDEGAKSVYEIINYDIIDVLVVYSDSFCNKRIVNEIVSRAKQNKKPVILINDEIDGCYSVLKDYDIAFRHIITHIIEHHGVKDTFFMAGRKDDPYSQSRLKIYQEVLEANGLVFDEEKVGYGDYWEEPTKKVMENLIHSGEQLPQAFICANDSMAVAVCDVLSKYGYKVPKDILVTGFDGIAAARFHSPQITTCNENLNGLAKTTMRMVKLAVEEGQPCCVMDNQYKPLISESCGCQPMIQDGFRIDAEYLFNALNTMEAHEENMYTWIDRMLGIKDMNGLFANLSGCIIKNSYVCLNSDFVPYALRGNNVSYKSRLSGEFLVIHSGYDEVEPDKTEILQLEDMVPELDDWAKDDTLYLLTAIYAGDEVCGFYAVRTDDIMIQRHKVKRVAKTLNLACNVSLNYFRQMKLRLSVENANVTNPITELPNLKGTVEWFNDFAGIEKNHNRSLSISVYGLPKYTYILENYGIEEAEEVSRFVAESLKIANPQDCFISHIADDGFAIINYYDDPEMIPQTIDSATSVFYSVVEAHNSNSNKEYYVEVNCGCTELQPGWSGTIEGFLKAANSEMYMNRLKNGVGTVVKEQIAPKVHYKALELLIQKNLFYYHFQPIVNAKNGEIFAYEALMRTEESIGMNPLEVLEAAKQYNYLYDIEKATMFNVLENYSRRQEEFGNRKIFINTIPGYFLNDEDIDLLLDKYGGIMNMVVFELTEQNTVSDEELAAIRKLKGNNASSQIAIDDYGAGHSNIVNLIRYAPELIKLDRFLISDIHKDQNKQMFVRSTLEFARMNHIKVLAEGVETSNELRMVIDLGVDLIQGYYTGRPQRNPMAEIDEEVRKEIIKANPLIR